VICRNNLGFGRGMTHARLSFAGGGQWEKGVRGTDARKDPGCAFASRFVAREKSVTVDYKFPFRGRVPDPSVKLDVEGSIYVAHEPVEGLVAIHIPFGDPCGKKATWPQQVESAHSGCV